MVIFSHYQRFYLKCLYEPIVIFSNFNQNLLLEFCFLLQKKHIQRVEWRMTGNFGHLTKTTDIFDKSLITSKRLEVELTVMSPLGYFRETLFSRKTLKKYYFKSCALVSSFCNITIFIAREVFLFILHDKLILCIRFFLK